MSKDYKSLQKNEILEYISSTGIKNIFSKLTYGVALYRPNDPIEYFIKRLKELRQNPNSEEKQYPRIIFVHGPPQCGKTTFCKQICSTFGMYYINVDNLIKNELHFKSQIGAELSRMMESGEDIPLEFKLQLLKNEIQENEKELDFVIDGFPKDLKEAIDFESNVSVIRFLILLDSSNKTMFKERILKGSEYNESTRKELLKSYDKTFEQYEKQTSSVRNYFECLKKIKIFDPSKSPEELVKQLQSLIC